jgi:hypothetical protein
VTKIRRTNRPTRPNSAMHDSLQRTPYVGVVGAQVHMYEISKQLFVKLLQCNFVLLE